MPKAIGGVGLGLTTRRMSIKRAFSLSMAVSGFHSPGKVDRLE
jgi:hypothetical protein